jgi:GTP-binding protein
MRDMKVTSAGTVRMEFIIPTRGIIGFRSDFLMMTRGTGVMYQNFDSYTEYRGPIPARRHGVQVSMNSGAATGYALFNLQDRGEIFISPGDQVYEGMIIGTASKGIDMVVNPLKKKKLSGMRSDGAAEEAIILNKPREMTLEFALEFIDDDELVEITPKHIRLRKKLLTEKLRKNQKRGRGE